MPYDKETGVPHFLRDEIDPDYEEVDAEGIKIALISIYSNVLNEG